MNTKIKFIGICAWQFVFFLIKNFGITSVNSSGFFYIFFFTFLYMYIKVYILLIKFAFWLNFYDKNFKNLIDHWLALGIRDAAVYLKQMQVPIDDGRVRKVRFQKRQFDIYWKVMGYFECYFCKASKLIKVSGDLLDEIQFLLNFQTSISNRWNTFSSKQKNENKNKCK